MFNDFQNKEIYIKAKELYILLNTYLTEEVPYSLRDQISRAAVSIILNFAEGYGRFSKNDKKHFYIISRGSLNEVVACFDLIQVHTNISDKDLEKFKGFTEELSKILSGRINSKK